MTEPAVLLAHGAGTNQDHGSVVELRDGIAAAGHPVLTFNYPYTERGRGRPDRQEVLLDCHLAADAWLRAHIDVGVVYAGRSMGARMATILAAGGAEMAGLVLYAYPLHAAGKPDRLRTEHLRSIAVPMHFFAGTRDPLSRMDLFDQWIRPLPGAMVTIIKEGDHSFRVPKRTGVTRAEVIAGIVAATVDWIRHL
ncbi:MAG: dienelactone hydrolase family protein [Acidimicrobiia bacterium]|nr:dienelactone hydrolase family protein [Acidimicrobiia bacterium]